MLRRARIFCACALVCLAGLSVRADGLPVAPAPSGTFTRAGAVFDYDPSSGGLTQYPANTPRIEPVLSCSRATAGERLVAEPLRGGGAKNMKVWCSNAAGLYAIGEESLTGYEHRIYLSADGLTDWVNPVVLVNNTATDQFPSYVEGLSALQGGRILAFVYNSVGSDAYYSDDNGATWTRTIDVDNPSSSPRFDVGYTHWQLCQRSDQAPGSFGTIVEGTRNDLTVPNYLWRSADNGATWKCVLFLPPGEISHFHRVSYHAGLHRWYADTGDDASAHRERNYYSDDDGVTWQSWAVDASGAPLASPLTRITGMMDYGHPTRIAVGSDGSWRVSYLDLQSWTYGPLGDFPATHYRGVFYAGGYFYSDFTKIDNLYYALSFTIVPQQDSTAKWVQDHVFVSPDMEHWALYWRRKDTGSTVGNGSTHFAGYVGGLIHIGSWLGTHYAIPPAKAELCNGMVLSPEKFNRLPALKADGEDATMSSGGWRVSATGMNVQVYNQTSAASLTGSPFDPSNVLSGTGSLYLSYQGGRSVDAYAMTFVNASAATEAAVAHCWIKVLKGGVGILGSWGRVQLPAATGAWTEVWGFPELRSATNLRQFVVGGQTDPKDGQLQMLVDGLEFIDPPLSRGWAPGYTNSVGDTRQAPESLQMVRDLPLSWTHMFGTRLLGSSLDLANKKYYFRSYIADANRLSIYGYNRQVGSEYTDFVVLQDPPPGVQPAETGWSYMYSPQASAADAFNGDDSGRMMYVWGSESRNGVTYYPNASWYVIGAVTKNVDVAGAGVQTVLTMNAPIAFGPADHVVGRRYEFVFGMEAADQNGPIQGSPVESGDRWLNRGAQVKLGLRVANGQARLTVSDGQFEHVSGALYMPLSGSVQIITGSGGIWGDKPGDNLMPMTLFDDVLENGALSDAELEARFAEATFSAGSGTNPTPADFRACMSGPGIHFAFGCDQFDFDGDMDVDQDDFGAFQLCLPSGCSR